MRKASFCSDINVSETINIATDFFVLFLLKYNVASKPTENNIVAKLSGGPNLHQTADCPPIKISRANITEKNTFVFISLANI